MTDIVFRAKHCPIHRTPDSKTHCVNLLVAESVGRVILYRDVLHHGLDDACVLFSFTDEIGQAL